MIAKPRRRKIGHRINRHDYPNARCSSCNSTSGLRWHRLADPTDFEDYSAGLVMACRSCRAGACQDCGDLDPDSHPAFGAEICDYCGCARWRDAHEEDES